MGNTSRSADQRTTGTEQARAGTVGPSWVLTALACGLVIFGPGVAWVVWISWTSDKASDAMHVAWFATVAIACLVAGGLAPRTPRLYLPLFVVAPASTLLTLFLWWSAEDDTGLFMIGIIIATPLVVGAAIVLLLLGHNLTPLRPRHHA